MQLPVMEYVEPEIYEFYTKEAEKIGLWIQAGPLVRSSYMADSLAEQGHE
jgi:lipoate synthase